MFLNSRCIRKREKFINANQLLLEFPEDKELQASLEAVRKEAEEEKSSGLSPLCEMGISRRSIYEVPRQGSKHQVRVTAEERTFLENIRSGTAKVEKVLCNMAKTTAVGVSIKNAWLADQEVLSLKS